MQQVGREALPVSTTAVALTVPATSKRALIYVAGAPVRWRADGTNPTSTTGMYVPAGAYIDWSQAVNSRAKGYPLEESWRDVLTGVKFIRDASAGGDAALEIAYFD